MHNIHISNAILEEHFCIEIHSVFKMNFVANIGNQSVSTLKAMKLFNCTLSPHYNGEEIKNSNNSLHYSSDNGHKFSNCLCNG